MKNRARILGTRLKSIAESACIRRGRAQEKPASMKSDSPDIDSKLTRLFEPIVALAREFPPGLTRKQLIEGQKFAEDAHREWWDSQEAERERLGVEEWSWKCLIQDAEDRAEFFEAEKQHAREFPAAELARTAGVRQ